MPFWVCFCVDDELVSLRESEEKLKQQQIEATRKENVLVMRLTTKEQEMQDYAVSYICSFGSCFYNEGIILILVSNICSQCLSQDLETWCPKLAIVKFLGVQVFKGSHNILRLQP